MRAVTDASRREYRLGSSNLAHPPRAVVHWRVSSPG